MKNKIIIIIGGILIVIGLVFGGYIIGRKTSNNDQGVSVSEAEKDKEHRYLTIVNNTGKVINEITILLEDETPILTIENPDEDSKTIQIDDAYSNHKDLVVKMIDNFDRVYKKTSETSLKGRSTITISQEDYVQQEGDWWKNISEWFNR